MERTHIKRTRLLFQYICACFVGKVLFSLSLSFSSFLPFSSFRCNQPSYHDYNSGSRFNTYKCVPSFTFVTQSNCSQIGYGGFFKRNDTGKKANKANKCHFSPYAYESVHEVLMMLITAKKGERNYYYLCLVHSSIYVRTDRMSTYIYRIWQ